MLIKLPYGDEQIPIDVPDNWINGRCYRPHPLNQCADVRAELMAVLSALPTELSLESLGEAKTNGVIAVDVDSPVVMRDVLPALVEMIEDETSLDSASLTILMTNRLWNPITPEDLPNLLPPEVLDHYRVVVHDPFDSEMLVELGVSTKKVPITVNRLYKEADLRILLSGVRPDLLLGFSGGRSLILPGLSGKDTLRAMYQFNNVADRNTRYGAFRDNPFHMAGVEATNMAGCDLCINVTLTLSGDPVNIFAGHFGKSQLDAMNKLRDGMVVRVKEPMDIVVTSGGGAPYDATLPQILNTLAAVESVLKPDGTIVIAAAMKEGFGPPPFGKLFEGNNTVQEALERLSSPRTFIPGQWLAQRFYSILQSHEVILYNKDLNEDLLWAAGLSPSSDITQAVHEAMQSHGQRCKIVALPDGPLGIGEISTPG